MLQEALAEAVLRLNEADEKEAETAAALEEADKKLRGLKLDREKMKDLEGREAQHVQVCKPRCVQRYSARPVHAYFHCIPTMSSLFVQARGLGPFLMLQRICKRERALFLSTQAAADSCRLAASIPQRTLWALASPPPGWQPSTHDHACESCQRVSPCHAG